jgi:hypothetical protein
MLNDLFNKLLTTKQNQIIEFKNQWETTKPDNKELTYDIAMEKIMNAKKEVQEHRE